jgi:hypothetical protein
MFHQQRWIRKAKIGRQLNFIRSDCHFRLVSDLPFLASSGRVEPIYPASVINPASAPWRVK